MFTRTPDRSNAWRGPACASGTPARVAGAWGACCGRPSSDLDFTDGGRSVTVRCSRSFIFAGDYACKVKSP